MLCLFFVHVCLSLYTTYFNGHRKYLVFRCSRVAADYRIAVNATDDNSE